jgi:hypothetical protein
MASLAVNYCSLPCSDSVYCSMNSPEGCDTTRIKYPTGNLALEFPPVFSLLTGKSRDWFADDSLHRHEVSRSGPALGRARRRSKLADGRRLPPCGQSSQPRIGDPARKCSSPRSRRPCFDSRMHSTGTPPGAIPDGLPFPPARAWRAPRQGRTGGGSGACRNTSRNRRSARAVSPSPSKG